jgi:hypothetical protein
MMVVAMEGAAKVVAMAAAMERAAEVVAMAVTAVGQRPRTQTG